MKIYDILWEMDGQDADLPKEIEFASDDPVYGTDGYDDLNEYLDDISDALSDSFGYLHNGFAVTDDVKACFGKKTYQITVSDSATYVIRSNSREDAEELARQYFEERQPDVETTVTDEEPQVEI